ncbi:single-stranded DNA-binding protein [Lacticaseibacillus pantheris]|jgi:single-strand DNA-binding protein
MINSVALTGRLTRDPELKYTQGGKAVTSFSLAVDRSFTNQQGQRETDFIECVVWRKAAEQLASTVHKGNLIGIEGRIQTRNYENQQGQRVYVTEVMVDRFSYLESKNATQGQQQSRPAQQTSQNNTRSTTQNDGGIDISDDDLPF